MAILPPTPNKNRQLRQYTLTAAQTPVDGQDGLASILIGITANESLKRGEPVRVAE